ncbi:MAG: hypothetical protein GXO22_07470 [Aquificae bacterium]|nr:hypothetical protein [Aquificota bacterium]
MEAKSWNQYVEIIAYDEEGNKKELSALYIVAVPQQDKLEKDIDFKCYRPTYIPRELVEKIGRAYGVATEFDIKNPEKYDIIGYRPDLDLYVFKEGMTFKEGLERIYKIFKDKLEEEGFKVKKIDVILS